MTGYKLQAHELEEIQKCAADPIYFIETYCKIVTLDEGVVSFKMFDKQKEIVHSMMDNRFSIILAPRQFGKTTIIAGMMCWYLVFYQNYTIACLADKMDHAENILERVQFMLDYLPDFLKPCDEKGEFPTRNKRSIRTANGNYIFGAPTTEGSIRGESVNFLYLDEFAIVPTNLADGFLANAMPTISSGKTTKIAITSTPKGLNHFWNIWNKAERGKNNFHPVRVNWWDRPDRDDEWAEGERKALGEIRFNQEYGCVDPNTKIELKNKITGEVIKISIADFLEANP